MAGLRPLDRAARRRKYCRPADGAGFRLLARPRHAGFPQQGDRHHRGAISATAGERAQVAGRAHSFRSRDRLQHAGIRDRAGDHRDSRHRHQGKRALQLHHRGDQSCGGAVRHRPGLPLRERQQLGRRLALVRAHGILRHRRGRGLHLLRLHRIRRGFDHRAGSQESAARFAHRDHRFAAGLHRALYSRWPRS